MRNQSFREEIKNSGIKFWQVAERMHKNDCNFSKWLRKDLTEDQKNEVRKIIQDILNSGEVY